MTHKGYNVATVWDIGCTKKTNQDSILVKVGEFDNQEFGLFIVADGMGGLSAGNVASSMATSIMKDWWENRLSNILPSLIKNPHLINSEFSRLFKYINSSIFEYGRRIDRKVGTTLSVLIILNDHYLIQHIGDSRIYTINKEIIQLTEDHTWVAEEVRKGEMTEREARTHPRRNLLTQCIGVYEKISPYKKLERITNTTAFLLCSDGFYSLLDEKEILDIVSVGLQEASEISRALHHLLYLVKKRGAHDNVSAILVVPNTIPKKDIYPTILTKPSIP